MNPGFQGLPMMAGGVYGMRPPYNMMVSSKKGPLVFAPMRHLVSKVNSLLQVVV